jgi:hypothetical protein
MKNGRKCNQEIMFDNLIDISKNLRKKLLNTKKVKRKLEGSCVEIQKKGNKKFNKVMKEEAVIESDFKRVLLERKARLHEEPDKLCMSKKRLL